MHTGWKKNTHSDISKFLIFLKEWLLNATKFFDRIRNRFSFHSFFHIIFLLIHPHFLVYIYIISCVDTIYYAYMVYNAASQHNSFFALWPPPCPTALCEPHNCCQAGIWAPRTSGRIPSLWVLDSASCDAKAFAFTTGSRFRVFLDGSCNCKNICSCDSLKTNHLKPRELWFLQWCAGRVMGWEISPNPKHQVLFFTDPNSPLRHLVYTMEIFTCELIFKPWNIRKGK